MAVKKSWEKINRLIATQNDELGINTAKVAAELKISRQRASQILSEMTADGLLYKTGSTKNARYFKPEKVRKKTIQNRKLQLIKNTLNLEEDLVFKELSIKLNLKLVLSENTFKIFNYSFTEMLNNAIDHSKSKKVTITVEIKNKEISFVIEDKGIGAFENVRKSFKLKSILEGMEHLFKGKQTSDPSRHSGQGIFFTSRIADKFILESNGYSVKILPQKNDTFLSEGTKKSGTLVFFSISKQSKRSLTKLFTEFSHSNFDFDKDHIRVTLSNYEGLLSRSQAKRLLNGLDRFSRIDFDFKGISEIGQAFADEIFRVYANNNPNTLLTYTNANSAVAFFIERARKNTL